MDKRIFIYSSLQSSVLQYAARDMAHGFRCNGWDVEVFRERWPGEPPIHARDIAETCMWFRPSIIFAVDGIRGQSQELWPLYSSFICWAQDALPHLLDPKMAQAMQPHDLVLTSFPGLAQRFIDATFNPEQVKHLPVGVNTDMFFKESEPPKEFTVGFPANIGHPGHGSPQERYDYYAEPVRWLIEAGAKVKLWGEGWQNPEFGQYWQGLVRNGPELREAYNSCSAILHVNRDTNNHQRVYEALACQRPVFAKRLPNDDHPDGIQKTLAVDEWNRVATFSSKEELDEIVRRYAFTVNLGITQVGVMHDQDYSERAKSVIRMVEAIRG